MSAVVPRIRAQPNRVRDKWVAPAENTQTRGRRVYRSRREILASNPYTGGQSPIGWYLIREPTTPNEVRSQTLAPLVNESRPAPLGPVWHKSRIWLWETTTDIRAATCAVSRACYVIVTLCYLSSPHPSPSDRPTQPKRRMAQKRYSPIHAPSLSMSELVCKTLDCDATDLLIDKWLEHRNDAYWDWFQRVRERKHVANAAKKGQVLLWNKGVFVPENIFCRTVDTGRLIPLDRTWTTHVYHHKSMQERRLSMMPVVFTMVGLCFFFPSTSLKLRSATAS